MSNLANPESTTYFTYESIRGDVQVRIRAKFLTEREQIRHDELWEEARTLDLADPKFQKLRDDMLSIGIVSPTVEELKTKLGRSDLLQLATRYPDQLLDIEMLLGKSRSRPQFIREPSAVDVAAPSAITPPAANATSQTPAVPLS